MKAEKTETPKIISRVILIGILLWLTYLFKVLSDESHDVYQSYKLHYDSMGIHPAYQQLPENVRNGAGKIRGSLANHHIISFEAYLISLILSSILMAALLFDITIIIKRQKRD